MKERAILARDAEAVFPIEPPGDAGWGEAPNDVSFGDWTWVGDDRVAWTMGWREQDRVKFACFVHRRGGGLVKRLMQRGMQGPVTTATRLAVGGGTAGPTPLVYEVDTLRKVGSLRGHVSTIRGLTSFPDHAELVTIGGRDAEPSDATVRVWEWATLKERGRVVTDGHPWTLAASRDRIYVRTYEHGRGSALSAFDRALRPLWTHVADDDFAVKLSVSPDEATIAELRSTDLLLRDRGGRVRASRALGALGRFRNAGSWGPPDFSPDGRWLLLTPEYRDAAHGTLVVDVATAEPVLRLRGVLRPRPRPGGGYGAWMGTDGGIVSFAELPSSLVEP